MSLSRTYRWVCRECDVVRSFSYRDTADIAAKVHADEFRHRVVVSWWAQYRNHDTVYLPTKKAAPVSQQGRLFS